MWSEILTRVHVVPLSAEMATQVGASCAPFSSHLNRNVLVVQPWEQASHAGDLTRAVEAGLVHRDDVTELGAVLAGTAAGRQSTDDITIFDSTGLAIQDLAIALAALERAGKLDLQMLDL